MGDLTIERDGNVIRVSGIIDEHSDFTGIFDGLDGKVIIDMDGIKRINSCGVREWVNMIKSCDLDIEYISCPTAVVEQFNMVPEFLGRNAVVKSFYARYYCEECDNEQNFLLEVEKHFPDPSDIEIPEFICDCGSPFEFDDDESEYFMFLE